MLWHTHAPPPHNNIEISVAKLQLHWLSITKLHFKIFKDPDFLFKTKWFNSSMGSCDCERSRENGSFVGCIKKNVYINTNEFMNILMSNFIMS